MKASLTLTCSLALLCLAMAPATVAAGVPQLINVQGMLVDGTGEPVTDGLYPVVFTIYTAASGGTALWQETDTVEASHGLFSIALGENVTLPASLFDSTELWLGMKVQSDDEEMTPRQRLTTSPYAFRVAGSSTGGGWVDDGSNVRLQTSGDNVGIGTSSPTAKLEVVGDMKAAQLDLGSPTQDGNFDLYRNGSASPSVEIKEDPYAGDGGSIWLDDGTGSNFASINPDGDAGGGYMWINRGSGGYGFLVDGNYNGTTEPMVEIDGSVRDVTFNMSLTDDACVVLPDNAISQDEILDEPGIASANYSSSVTLSDAMQDIVTVEITIPTAGYIVLEAMCYAKFSGTTGANDAYVQIDENSGGGTESPHTVWVGLEDYPSTDDHRFPVYVQRVYNKAQGTYTFRLEAERAFYAGGTATIWFPTLTATFYPKSYGSVMTVVGSSEASQFDNAVALPTQIGDGELGSSEQLYEVDLRELELKAARLRAELRQVQREMDEALAAQQQEARSKQQIEK